MSSAHMKEQDIIKQYLYAHRYMTLATSSPDGKPEAATVGYVVYGDKLLFNTYSHYRKYPNLTDNPRVSCVVTSDDLNATLQLDGTVELLEGKDLKAAKEFMVKDWPEEVKYFTDDRTRFFIITPTWVRLRDYNTTPPTLIEHKY